MEKRRSRSRRIADLEEQVAVLTDRMAAIDRWCEEERKQQEALQVRVAELTKEIAARPGQEEPGASIYQVVSEWLNGAEASSAT